MLIGILIPFFGTTIGSSFVFLLKKEIKPIVQKILLGFASGVMIAASVWSLLIPAIEMSENQGRIAWIPAVVGFLIGVVALIIVNKIVEKIEDGAISKNKKEILNTPKIDDTKLQKTTLKEKVKSTTMLVLAVTLHNIPEGMAVGVAFAGLISQNAVINFTEALALSIGIAIQNIPEGAIISMPLHSEGNGKIKSFLGGVLSGLVEPIGAIITILLTKIIVPFLPYFLSFAAGAMIYAVVSELIPEAQADKKSNLVTIAVAVGFAIMMLLDVALG
ncbi:MAG: ZIP family metal transporter [Clostridia bacterium]